MQGGNWLRGIGNQKELEAMKTVALEKIAVTIHEAAAMLSMSKTEFWGAQPSLKSAGMRRRKNRIDVESLKRAWATLCDEEAGDVRASHTKQNQPYPHA